MALAPLDELRALLRSMRKRSKLAAPAIADTLGISRAGLYWWEGPHSKIDAADIRRLLNLYGCSEAEITEALDLRSRIDTSREVALEDAPTVS